MYRKTMMRTLLVCAVLSAMAAAQQANSTPSSDAYSRTDRSKWALQAGSSTADGKPVGDVLIKNATILTATHGRIANGSVLVRAGKIAQVGTPAQIYESPATKFVADFIGSVMPTAPSSAVEKYASLLTQQLFAVRGGLSGLVKPVFVQKRGNFLG